MARQNSPGLQAWVGLPSASALKVAAEAVLVERCLACEAEAVGTMEGSRFYPDPVCTHVLETRVYQVGVCEQAAPANVS